MIKSNESIIILLWYNPTKNRDMHIDFYSEVQ